MGIEIKRMEQGLTLERLALLLHTNTELGQGLIKVGYPNEYPEKYKDLENAYENIRNALILAICEEAKALETLK